MIIMKFGGTSVGNAGRIRNAADIVKRNIQRKPVVVVSAVAKITDALVKLCNECSDGRGSKTLGYIRKMHYSILKELKIKKGILDDDLGELGALAEKTMQNKIADAGILDSFMSFGERMSSKIVAEQLKKIGVDAQALNSWELGFLTDSEFGNAEPLESAYQNLNKNIKKLKVVPVITGFVGKTEDGDVTTLGRGGSDYTAAIIGAAINAEEIQIWTDVDGIMSTDPKIVGNAKTMDKVSFEEASELAYFGARVLHPKTILPAMEKNIPVKVLNSFNPENKGTAILSKPGMNGKAPKAIAYKKDIILIHLDSTRMLGAYGFLARIFEIFEDYRKSVDVISTSEVSVSLTVDNDKNIGRIVKELEEISSVEVSRNKAIICIVGEGMKRTPEVAGRIFTAIGRNGINTEMISQGASKINITFIVDGKDADKTVRILHNEYFG